MEPNQACIKWRAEEWTKKGRRGCRKSGRCMLPSWHLCSALHAAHTSNTGSASGACAAACPGTIGQAGPEGQGARMGGGGLGSMPCTATPTQAQQPKLVPAIRERAGLMEQQCRSWGARAHLRVGSSSASLLAATFSAKGGPQRRDGSRQTRAVCPSAWAGGGTRAVYSSPLIAQLPPNAAWGRHPL